MNSVSANRKMNYYDKIEIHKQAWKDKELFNSYLTVLMDVISDNDLALFAIKELVNAINVELDAIQISNDQ